MNGRSKHPVKLAEEAYYVERKVLAGLVVIKTSMLRL